jgi:hypothetical protein
MSCVRATSVVIAKPRPPQADGAEGGSRELPS